MGAIRKIRVSKGIYWVGIPAAQLGVLCACPADSVKHLMKMGLIVSREEKGVTFETGPNAILLSDILIQNGRFANLAEWPVLQMLYRQGILIPGHPNNTGEKPILIGSEGQVRSQMNYIYRGNYGLISEEELCLTGVSPVEARQMMRLKLKFAFGRIQPTEELLDTRIVHNEPVEIKNGVFVKRIGLNVFQFQYGSDTVNVDLNLAAHEMYECPYPLGFQNMNREYFGVIHSGNGDGWDINRPTMSSIIMFQGKIYLIDAGPNITHSLSALGIGVNEIEGIFQTHAHDDHFCGMAALMRADHRIKYFATPLVRASVAKKLSALISRDESEFNYYFDATDLVAGEWNSIDGLEVKPLFSPHPVETTILIFRAKNERGYSTYGHYADIVSLEVLRSMVTEDSTAPGIDIDLFNRVAKDYLVPLDLKKIDIGGGMIHGNAEDFNDDASGKIVLSHTAIELTNRQKEIGSGAPFGMVDQLIPGFQDYLRVYAYNFLSAYFPAVPVHFLRMLLNHPLKTFNPESILLKSGENSEFIYLILSGEVEMILAADSIYSVVSAGGLVGETAALTKMPARETYRAANFVQTMQISSSLYLDFVRENGLYEEIVMLQSRRHFLQKSYLFNESISYTIQNKIALAMNLHHYERDQEIPRDDGLRLFMINSGTVDLVVGDDVVEKLSAGDFFGEGQVLFNVPCLYRVRITSDAEIYHIRGPVLTSIPIVRWKLNESHDRRVGLMLNPDLISVPLFQWREEYEIGIGMADDDHRELLARADALYQAVSAGKARHLIEQTMDFLIDYAESHFAREEDLMLQLNYPEYDIHKRKHRDLIDQVQGMKNRVMRREVDIDMEFLGFLKEWVINHILTEDRKMTPFLKKTTVPFG